MRISVVSLFRNRVNQRKNASKKLETFGTPSRQYSDINDESVQVQGQQNVPSV